MCCLLARLNFSSCSVCALLFSRMQILSIPHPPSTNTYHLQVGCILVTYHKDQQVNLSDVIKTAAMLCGDCKPIGVRQVIIVNMSHPIT